MLVSGFLSLTDSQPSAADLEVSTTEHGEYYRYHAFPILVKLFKLKHISTKNKLFSLSLSLSASSSLSSVFLIDRLDFIRLLLES